MARVRTAVLSTLFSSLTGLAALAASASASAADVHSVGSGDWNDASTWRGGVVPTRADSVYVDPGNAVTIPVGFTFIVDNRLLVVEGGRLIVAGTLDINGSVVVHNPKSATVTSVNQGTITNNGSGSFTIVGIEFRSAGTFTNEGQVTIVAGATFWNDETGTLANNGTFVVAGLLGNEGTVVNRGAFNFSTGVKTAVVNRGTFTNELTGKLNEICDLDSYKPFRNLGTMSNRNCDSTGIHIYDTFENHGTLTLGFRLWNHSSATLTNAAGATVRLAGGPLYNEGLVDNFGAIPTATCPTCVISQYGTMKNQCGGTYGTYAGTKPVEIPCGDAGTGDASTAEDAGATDSGAVDAAAPESPPGEASSDGGACAYGSSPRTRDSAQLAAVALGVLALVRRRAR